MANDILMLATTVRVHVVLSTKGLSIKDVCKIVVFTSTLPPCLVLFAFGIILPSHALLMSAPLAVINA